MGSLSMRQFIDHVFRSVEINELVERRKCAATGKVRFNNKAEASFFIHWLKWCYRQWRRRPVRRKHDHKGKEGRPRQRYVYNCVYCNGYHITKENPYDYQQKKEKYHKKYLE